MEYYYENRNNSCTLVCRLTEETMNNYVYYMMKSNSLSNIIQPVYEQGEDGYERLVYNLEGKCTLNDYIAYYSSADRLKKLYDGLKRAWSELDSYMIDDRYCIWDFNYVYVDCITGEPYIICLAIESYVSEPLDRDGYLGYIERYTGVNDSFSMEVVPEYDEYEDMYDEDYYETRVLCQSDYGWIEPDDYGNSKMYEDNNKMHERLGKQEKNLKDGKAGHKRKETKIARKAAKKAAKEAARKEAMQNKSGKKRKPKVVRVVKADKEVPCYIIPGFNA